MPDILTQHNIGALVDLVRATAAASATAAGSGDNSSTTGATIDRQGLSTGSMPRSGLFGIIYDATLGSGATLSLGYAVQDSADGTNWSDYQTAALAVVATGISGGGVVAGQLNVQVDLGSARRYTRFNTKQDLSAGSTDTSLTRGVAVLGGFDRLAAPN